MSRRKYDGRLSHTCTRCRETLVAIRIVVNCLVIVSNFAVKKFTVDAVLQLSGFGEGIQMVASRCCCEVLYLTMGSVCGRHQLLH